MKVLLLLIFLFFSDSESFWKSDYKDAKNEAVSSDKNILIYFSGSDWCKPCIQLKTLILETEEFKSYAQDHYILYQADFPRLKKNKPNQVIQKQNDELASKLNKNGVFPLIVVLDKDENVLSVIEYKHQSIENFIQQLERL